MKAAAGRNRINVLCVLDAVTLKLETVINTTYVNVGTITELLEKLAKQFTRLPILCGFRQWTVAALRLYQVTGPGGGKLKRTKVRLKPEWGL